MSSLLQCKFSLVGTQCSDIIQTGEYFPSFVLARAMSKKIPETTFRLMQKSYLNMGLITMHNNGKLPNRRTDFNWNKIIGNVHRWFFSSRCSQFMTEIQLEKSAIDLFTIFHHLLFAVRQLFASHIRNQSKFPNLFRVNSLNNLHHVARLTPGERFLWIMTRFFCSRSCDLYRIGFRNCRHLQTTRRGARTTSGEENVIIYLNYVKMFELLSDKSEFHGQFSRPD